MLVTIDQLEGLDFSQFNVIYLVPKGFPDGKIEVWQMNLPGSTGPLAVEVDGPADAENARMLIDRLRSLQEPPINGGYISELQWQLFGFEIGLFPRG
ncbi:hypothetical protein [Pseudomonas nitroreducens]|uniref:hypothetical protein n=1 Tax=Pseudomonas nitroreducens TaxID=46680 RepID=UPI00351D4801